jgi:hypothetical protein
MNTRRLEESLTVDEYLKVLEKQEKSRQLRLVEAGMLRLTAGGLLQIEGQAFEVPEGARKDLAKLARIPATYFEQIDPELRATNFNRRLLDFFGSNEGLEVVISNDRGVQHVQQRRQLGHVEASQAIDALLDGVAASVSNDIRVVEYGRETRLDVALVARALQAEPRPGDIVCGGVHLTIDENGAVQVGPVSFRLICRNGAMARVCAGGQHRLRRGLGRDGTSEFLATLREFGRTAWQDWEHVKRGLEELAQKRLDRNDIANVIRGLRQSPFFISARAARLVEEELRRNADDLTFYDLHNAITFVGTHEEEVLPQYRYRLRLGAGQLARGRVGVCQECRRLMIGGEASRN